jgi:clan AA aspartic protease (TIGR02281 family)
MTDHRNNAGNEIVLAATLAGLLAGCSASPNQQTSDQQAPVVQAAQTATVVRPTPTAGPAAPKIKLDYRGSEVPLENDGGTFVVPVTINDTIALKFTIDSGAADVTIPSDVASTLVRAGTISAADYVGSKTFVLADGSEVPSPEFRIKSLRVGSLVLHDVVASISNDKGSLLLGQSFLTRLKGWSIDNARHVLVLNGGAPDLAQEALASNDAPPVAGAQATEETEAVRPANQPTWAAVAMTDKVSDYVDTANITNQGDHKYFWVKSILVTPYQNIKVVVSLRQVLCSGNLTRTLLVSSYDADGALVKRTTDYASRPWGAWKTPQAGSAVQTEVQQVCSSGFAQ